MSTAIKQLVTTKLIIISYRGSPGGDGLSLGLLFVMGRAPSIDRLTLTAHGGTPHEGSQF